MKVEFSHNDDWQFVTPCIVGVLFWALEVNF